MTAFCRFIPPLLCLVFACSSESRHLRPEGARSASSKSEANIAKASIAKGLKFSPFQLNSYWVDGASQRALAEFRAGDYFTARSSFAALVLSDLSLSARRDLMVALCSAKLGDHQKAAGAFERILISLPLLKDFVHLQAAKSYFYLGKTSKSREHLREIDSSSLYAARAQLLQGDILRSESSQQRVYEHYRRYLGSHPLGPRRAEAESRFAEAAASLGKLAEAQRAWCNIVSRFPLTRAGRQAEKFLGTQASFGTSALLRRAHVYYRNNRNEASETDFAEVLKRPSLDDAQRCDASYHLASSVYKQRERRRAAPLFVRAMKACETSGSADLFVKAAYRGGRSYAKIGDDNRALKLYSQIESQYPAHSYADDALLLRSEVYEKLGDLTRADELLASLPKIYPKGDMVPEALWRLGWRSFKKEKYAGAISYFSQQVKAEPIEGRLGAKGQALYWIARSWSKAERPKKAIAAYRETIAEFPLSYYALLSLNRLRESHSDEFLNIRGALLRGFESESRREGALKFRDREVYKSAGFFRVVEFLRLGLAPEARAELRNLGFRSSSKRAPLRDPDAIDKAWAVAMLQYRIGEYSRALWSTRWHLLQFKKHWPEGGWTQRWRVSYPPAFRKLIETQARAQAIPADLVSAFVREESGFDPRQESHANAIGLSQLIMSTAKRFARGTGITVTRESLQDPETNLRISTRFIAFLMRKWNGDLSLVTPSYNAGESAVARWLIERGDWERDAFIEEIPYDETRRYAKRVISSYFAYRYLAGGEIPVLHN